jgi:hypothetical protein
MVKDFRSDFNSPKLPFIVGQLADDFVSGYNTTPEVLIYRRLVNNILINAPAIIDYCATVSAVGEDQDGTHFYATGARGMGAKYFHALISEDAKTKKGN